MHNCGRGGRGGHMVVPNAPPIREAKRRRATAQVNIALALFGKENVYRARTVTWQPRKGNSACFLTDAADMPWIGNGSAKLPDSSSGGAPIHFGVATGCVEGVRRVNITGSPFLHLFGRAEYMS